MERHWSELARAQHGAVSRAQLRSAALTARQIDRFVETGRLVVVHRGIYRLADAPRTFEQRVMAGCLAAGGVASHRSAAALWEFRACESRAVEVTVDAGRHPERPGVLVHSTTRLAKVDRTILQSLPVTAPGRTLLDLGMVERPEVVESAMEDALHRGLVSVDWLRRVIERGGGQGRDGTAILRALLEERAPGQAPTESALEDELVRVLRRGGLPAPVRQFWLGSVRLDVSYPDDRLAIEAQSKKWHSGAADLQRDCDKFNLLTQHGWRLLVFTAYDIRRRPAWVVDAVKNARAGTLAA